MKKLEILFYLIGFYLAFFGGFLLLIVESFSMNDKIQGVAVIGIALMLMFKPCLCKK